MTQPEETAVTCFISSRFAHATTQTNVDAGAYPAHVVGGWRAVNGVDVDIRPIAAADGGLIHTFVRSLSSESRYLRFMSPVTELGPQTLDRLTQIDHQRDAALIAVLNDTGGERVVGVARYALAADGESCEFAIVVADDWRRRGLGRRLLTLLVDTAIARALKRIRGEVLAMNAPMLAFVTTLGFTIGPSPQHPWIRRVTLEFDADRGRA